MEIPGYSTSLSKPHLITVLEFTYLHSNTVLNCIGNYLKTDVSSTIQCDHTKKAKKRKLSKKNTVWETIQDKQQDKLCLNELTSFAFLHTASTPTAFGIYVNSCLFFPFLLLLMVHPHRDVSIFQLLGIPLFCLGSTHCIFKSCWSLSSLIWTSVITFLKE